MPYQAIYETPALRYQHMSEHSQKILESFYRQMLSGCQIHTIHDCSIGAGGTTLPLAGLGYLVSGSDLSSVMLEAARENFALNGYTLELFVADFREFGRYMAETVNCVISTGNSLPHVNLEGFHLFLDSAYSSLADEGYLFFDLRNWDALLAERPLIYIHNPIIMTAEEHRSFFQLFSWHDDNSVTFSFVTSLDREGQHVSEEILQAPRYYPLRLDDILSALVQHGYRLLNLYDLDSIWTGLTEKPGKTGSFRSDFSLIQWYGVLAQKCR